MTLLFESFWVIITIITNLPEDDQYGDSQDPHVGRVGVEPAYMGPTVIRKAHLTIITREQFTENVKALLNRWVGRCVIIIIILMIINIIVQ